MKVMYETVVDDIGNWDCFLVLVNEEGKIERVEDDVKSEKGHFSYAPISRGRVGQEFHLLSDEFRAMNRENIHNPFSPFYLLFPFYLLSVTPCTGERSWFIPACQNNGIDDYEILSACWENNND